MKSKLFLGDCLVKLKELGHKTVDCVIADLPYNTTRFKWDSLIPFDLLWAELHQVAKDDAAILLFGKMPFTAKLVLSNIRNFRQHIVVEKSHPTNFFHLKTQLGNITEDIIVFSKRPYRFYPQKEPSKMLNIKEIPRIVKAGNVSASNKGYSLQSSKDYDPNLRYLRNILKMSNTSGFTSKERRYHPTQKGQDILLKLVELYSKEGDTILDFCMGSGSTGVAALTRGRKFIGIEKDKGYYKIAKERIGVVGD